MKTIEERIDEAADFYADWHGDSEPDSYDDFTAGAKWALSHLWISIEDELPPTDGDYLTLIKQEGSYYVEIAPWRDGEYQGSQIMAVMFGQHIVTHWMQIPPLSESEKGEQ